LYSPDPGAVAEVVLYVLVVLVFTVFGFALGVVVFLDSVTNVRGIVCVWTLKGVGGAWMGRLLWVPEIFHPLVTF
jgi:hypothetical protein